MASEIRIANREGGILEITLNAPAAGNALSAEMALDVTAALHNLDPETRAVLFTGDGADFCAGRRATMPPPGARKTALELKALELKALIADPVLDFYEVLRA